MEAKQLLQDYGNIREEEVNGRVVTVLPTCNVPFDYLLEENWKGQYGNSPKARHWNLGNFRFVWNITQLCTGEQIAFYVKHPERVFTRSQRLLDNGRIWWGGPKSGEQAIYLQHPLVEEQTVWQAVYLLELYKQGIPAEVPLAIVKHPDGNSELIVHDVTNFPYDKRFADKELEKKVKEIGFVPEDLASHNLVGRAIIDVNRWLWPPHTDSWSCELTDYIKKEIFENKEDK